MKNIKRILNLILIIFVVLSAFAINKVFAIRAPELTATQIVTAESDSEKNGDDALLDSIVEEWEYLSDYDMFCVQKGVYLFDKDAELDKKLVLAKKDADGNVISTHEEDVGYIYKKDEVVQNVATGYNSFTDNTTTRAIYKEYLIDEDGNDVLDHFGNKIEYPKLASPSEAYILAEMFNNIQSVNDRNVVSIEIDESGEEKDPTSFLDSIEHFFAGIFGITIEERLEKYHVLSTTYDGEEVNIYNILGQYYMYKGGILIPINISEEEIKEATGYKRNYVQRAWWKTKESRNVSEYTNNETFYNEATAYEEYILEAAGVDEVKQLVYAEQEYKVEEIFSDGSSETAQESSGTIKAPVLNYEPKWVDLGENAKVVWNEDDRAFRVGPFSIDYITYSGTIETEFSFAGIESAVVKTNIEELVAEDDQDDLQENEYQFLHQNGDRNSKYPEPNEVFYLIIPYAEGLNSLQNLRFNFRYMNAGAEFITYEGTAYKETWEIVGNDIQCIDEDEIDLQDMVEVQESARWYEYVSIETNRGIDIPKRGDLTIVKKVINKDTNEPIQVEEDKIYQFKVTIRRANDEGEYKNTSGGYLNEVEQIVSVKVKKGSSTGRVTLEPEYWKNEDAPFYEVEEIGAGTVKVGGYSYIGTELENASGQLKENEIDSGTNYEGTPVIAKNLYGGTTGKKGKLKIVKEISNVTEDDPIQKEAIFNFEVKIDKNENGTFDAEEIKTEKIIVAKGQKSAEWISPEIIWYGETGPKYEVTEKDIPEGYKFKRIYNNTGNLEEEKIENVKAAAENELDVEKGYIQIEKHLIDDNGPKAADKDETFAFEIYIDNTDNGIEDFVFDKEATVTVPRGSSDAISEPIRYEWPTGNTPPICKVIEKENVNGYYKFISINPEQQQLAKDDTKIFEVTNKFTTVGKHGSLRITKTVSQEVKANTKFYFEVIIDGQKEEAIVEILAGQTSGVWQSKEFYWDSTGTAPKYSVRETDIPSNYILRTISDGDPSDDEEPYVKGRLSDIKPVDVVATNELIEENEGFIKIIKELKKDGAPYSPEKREIFDFEIYIDNTDDGVENFVYDRTESVSVEVGSSSGVSKLIKYKWYGTTSPKIKIVEKPHERYKNISIDSDPKELLKDDTVPFSATNEIVEPISKEATIKLYKRLVDENGDPISAVENSTFNFKVYVTYSDGREECDEVTVEVGAGENSAFVDIMDPTDPLKKKAYIWKEGEKEPTFKVEEETPTGEWKEIAIVEDNNNLEAGETVINCYNGETEIYHKGELQIAKILKDIEKNEVSGKEFKFKVEVNNVVINNENLHHGTWNNNDEVIVIKAGDSWSKEFMWRDGSNPTYEVIELKDDETTPVDSTKYERKDTYQETNYSSSDTGTTSTPNTNKELKANNTVLVEYENKIVSDGYDGTIQIHKDLIVEDKIRAADLGNPIFGFKVTVFYDDPNEYFTYNGEAYNKLVINPSIIINNKDEHGNDISVDNVVNGITIDAITVNFEDENNGPKYLVEEISSPLGWQLINTENASGKVSKGINTAKFTNKLPIKRIYEFTMELGGNVWNDTDYHNGKPVDTGNDGIRKDEEEGIGNVKVEVYQKGNSSAIYTLYTDCNGKWQIPKLEVPESGEEYYVIFGYDGQTYEATTELMTTEVDDSSGKYIQGTASEFTSISDRTKYLKGSMAKELNRDSFNEEFKIIKGKTPIDDDGKTEGLTDTGLTLNYVSKDVEYNGYTKKASELITEDEDGKAKYEMKASTAEFTDPSDPSNEMLYYPFDNQTALVNVDREILVGVPTVSYYYHAAYPYLNNINLGLVERPHADIAIEKDLEEAIVVVNGKIYKYRYGEIANAQFAEYPDLLYKQIQVNQKNINYTLNLYKSDYYYRAAIYTDPDAGAVNIGGTDTTIGNALENYLISKGISTGLNSLNLDVYLTYKISVTNESDIYDVEVNQISDYVDSSLELVTEADVIAGKHKKYIDNIDGTSAGEIDVVSGPTNWKWNISSLEENAGWGPVIETKDDTTPGWREGAGIKYDRYTTGALAGKKIQSGETVSSKLTFQVRNVSGNVQEEIDLKLGDKNNIVEIDSYSTYYTDGKVAGRVDEDSAPENINFAKNSSNWYEDDTEKSPTLKLGLYEQVRNINGYAWEDEDDEANPIQYNQVIGDGILSIDDAGTITETLIEDMTTELVEKVTIDGIDYDFIWPTDDWTVDSTGNTVEVETTFDSTTATGLDGSDIGRGRYEFTGIPAGDYVVRFTYGDENTLKQAVDTDGNIVYETDDYGNIKYSGQDYKSTTYQTNYDINSDGIIDSNDWMASNNIPVDYLSNEWHDLETENSSDYLAEARVSDARDDESRRLEVIAKSQNMFYENTSIMSTNTSSYGLDQYYIDESISPIPTPSITDDPLKTYYMESNTAKLNMNIESVLNSRQAIVDVKTSTSGFFNKDYASEVGGVRVHVLNANRKLSNDDSINVKFIKYDVNNIDFGIETRSENNVKLDKQIEQITLKTSAGDILIDAYYNISYDSDGNVSISLNTIDSKGTENLQALNRTTEQLGFRYLNVDKDLLQGATITIKYRITALNTGEVDRCNEALIDLGDLVNSFKHSSYTTLEDLLRDLRDEEADATTGYVYGQYLGQIYYQGATIRNSTLDAVVSTKVKQVIDYVDNDVVFSQIDNVNVDSSWTNTSTSELEDNRYIDSTHEAEDGRTLIENGGDVNYGNDKILDSRGVAYESDSKNNLIVSVENEPKDDDGNGTIESHEIPNSLSNPTLLRKIAPYDYNIGDIDNHTDDGIDHSSYINVTVSRYYSSDMDIEEIENIAETLKLYNDVGRRDLKTIQGNTKPALGPAALLEELDGNPNENYENDSSATELITLSPPTGTVITAMLALQVMAIVLVAITILAGGIAIIKRKVLIK